MAFRKVGTSLKCFLSEAQWGWWDPQLDERFGYIKGANPVSLPLPGRITAGHVPATLGFPILFSSKPLVLAFTTRSVILRFNKSSLHSD